MDGCVFCKIAAGEIPSAKFWEDKEFVALLDINPNTKGMAIVMPKKHFPSYAFDMADPDYSKLMLAAKKVALLLDRKLGVKRTALVMEGMGIDHAHVKLYPLHGLGAKFKETWADKKVFFDKYEGYVSTQLGPKADPAELAALAKKLRVP